MAYGFPLHLHLPGFPRAQRPSPPLPTEAAGAALGGKTSALTEQTAPTTNLKAPQGMEKPKALSLVAKSTHLRTGTLGLDYP